MNTLFLETTDMKQYKPEADPNASNLEQITKIRDKFDDLNKNISKEVRDLIFFVFSSRPSIDQIGHLSEYLTSAHRFYLEKSETPALIKSEKWLSESMNKSEKVSQITTKIRQLVTQI